MRSYEQGKRNKEKACFVCQQYRPACRDGVGNCGPYNDCLAVYHAPGAECPR